MLVVLPVCSKDLHAAENLVEWSYELEGEQVNYKCLLAIEGSIDVSKLLYVLRQLFSEVVEFRYDKWEGSQNWPWPQNYAWQTVARYVSELNTAWYWWETDVVPLKKGWLSTLVREYESCGKLYMGHIVYNSPNGPYMNGAAFYPPNLVAKCTRPFLAHNTPFDVAMQMEIRQFWHPANHLMSHIRKPTREGISFPDQGTFDVTFEKDNKFVVFHGCSDGSLIEVLRQITPKSVPEKVVKTTKSVSKSLVSKIGEYVHWRIKVKRPTIIHCVERHHQNSSESERRVDVAVKSWETLYESGLVKPCHYWEYRRDTAIMGDSRILPFLKDVLLAGLNQTKTDNDIVMLTNDDTVLHPDIADLIITEMKEKPCISSFRLNYLPSDKDLTLSKPSALREELNYAKNDLGRDMFAFTRTWLKENWYKIPDFVLGELGWDLVLAALVRMEYGVPFTKENWAKVMPECEIEKGYVLHEHHQRSWMTNANFFSASKKHNRALCNQFAKEFNCPAVIQEV